MTTRPGDGTRTDVAEIVDVLRSHAAETDREARFPSEGMKALRDSGIMGLLVPPEYGGRGAGLGEFVRVAQDLASGCLSTALIWAMHCQQVDAVVQYGGRRLREELLPAVARGEKYLASVTTEPKKGGDLMTARAALRERGGELAFERDAPVVTGGAHADGYLITLRSSDTANPDDVCLVYADRSRLVVRETGEWNALGMRATHSVGLHLSGTVRHHDVVGRSERYREIAVESLIPLAHLGWSACWLGTARSAFGQLLAHLRADRRNRGGAPPSDLLRERVARVRLDLELVHAYLRRVCDEVRGSRDAGESLNTPSRQIHLNSLKIAASELTFRAVDRMVDIAGLATGYLEDSPVALERHFRDLRSARLNYSNDRLWKTNGALALFDTAVDLA